jgi:hypothetical protein
MHPELKTIRYRGGLVTFRIPARWREEYGAEGGGTFYEDAPDSPTFRLGVITLRAPAHMSPVTAATASSSLLQSLRQHELTSFESLPDGRAFARYAQSTIERGQRIHITFWSVAHAVPPDHCRIATFSYTLREDQRGDSRFQQELELLDREVKNIAFSPQLGI